MVNATTRDANRAQQRRNTGAIRRLRQRILDSTSRFWHPSDGKGVAPSTVQHLLNELVHRGELKHIRKGLYWRGVKTPLGMSPPPVHDLVKELAPGPGTGPAGLSAANLLHLSTQVPRRSQVAVPARPPEDAGSISFISRAGRTGRSAARLNQLEVALLEMLDGWEKLLEVTPREGWDLLRQLVVTGAVRASNLARASKTEPGPVRARLAELLREAGAARAAAVVPAVDPRTWKSAMKAVPTAAAA